jgi:hypothetical protein
MAFLGSAGLSISQLKSLLVSQTSELKKLHKQRAGLQSQIDKVDARIAKLNGAAGGGGHRGGGGGTRTRAKNKKSLVDTLKEVLSKGKPLPVGEIVEGVLATGYKSSSPNFRAIVNQTLIKERKSFASAGRGVYGLKK